MLKLKEYPFRPKFMQLSSGHKISYLDERSDKSKVVVMFHGNPTWSFFYRHLIANLTDYRVIAIDNLGMGLSDKPIHYNYTLAAHIKNASEVLITLNIKNASFIVHDWGGAIGFGVAEELPGVCQKIVAMNTASFRSLDIPFRIFILKLPIIGRILIQGLNLFSKFATTMTTVKPLSSAAIEGYLYPYKTFKDRIGIYSFVQDIPLHKFHPSFKTLVKVEEGMKNLDIKLLLLWGAQDFCFTTKFLQRYREFFPRAQSKVYENAGHYLLEDEGDDILKTIQEFLNEHH